MAGDMDFYGYSRERVGQTIYSSDYASLYFANTAGGAKASASKAALVQSAALAYNQQVIPRFEGGSHELFWLTGQSRGTLQVGRLVGDKGILDGIRYGSAVNDVRKGVLGGVEFKIGRLGMQGVTVKQEVLILSGCMLSGWGVSFNTGGLDVSESMSVEVALVKRGLQKR
jgi:hypothetical protein